MNGVGMRRLREVGKYVGLHYQKSPKFVGNSHVVAAKKAVLDIASARKLPCSALSFVDSAQIKYCNNNI